MTDPAPWYELEALDAWRCRSFDLGLVGVYPNGIGYGNLSRRIRDTETFWVTGSATGPLPRLGPTHYTRVTRISPAENTVMCEGPIQASSESMSHGTIYAALPAVGAVIHVHSRRLWDAHIHRLPTTAAEVPYGTPAMCEALSRILADPVAVTARAVVMAGHEEGLFVFGATLDDAGDRLLALMAQAP